MDDLVAVVHASYQQVLLAGLRWMPLDPPNASTDIVLCDRPAQVALVEYPQVCIIAVALSSVRSVLSCF